MKFNIGGIQDIITKQNLVLKGLISMCKFYYYKESYICLLMDIFDFKITFDKGKHKIYCSLYTERLIYYTHSSRSM